MRRKNNIKQITFCGITAALSTVIMLLAGIVPAAVIALPAMAGCLLIAVVVETSAKWGFAVYAVCSVLSMLLVADKEASLFYLLFFGYYPVLYACLARIGKKPLRVLVKLLIFNAAFILEGLISVYILHIPIDFIEKMGTLTIPILMILANITFVVYDFALEGLAAVYIRRFHGKINKIFRF